MTQPMFQYFKKYSQKNKIDFSINPVTLNFKDHGLETMFRQAYFQSNLQVGRACHLIAIFFYGMVAWWEASVGNPSSAGLWFWVFWAVAAFFLAGLSVSYFATKYYAKYWQQLFAFYVLMTGAGFTFVTAASGPKYAAYNFVGIIFCLVFCYSFIRLTFVWAVGAGCLIVTGYIFCGYIFTDPPVKQILSNFFYLFGINLLGMMVGYSLELMSRRDFILNTLLKDAENRTKEMNIKLENIVADRTVELVESNENLTAMIQREKELVLKLENEEAVLQTSLASLQQQQQLLDSIGRIAHIGGWSINTKTNEMTWTEEVFRIFEIDGQFTPTIENIVKFYLPECREAMRLALEKLLNTSKPYDLTLNIKTAKGNLRWIHAVGKANIKDDEIVSVYGSFQDITKTKQDEAERRLLETQLLQSQKMDTIGTLAGGIAHDFNNILFPILGYSEMLIEDLKQENPELLKVKEIHTSALRAKELVQQILTFSRQEISEPRLIKIQPILKEALRMIRATIPTTIDISRDIDKECGPIKADPTQVHQIIMNLATNAYHAMEEKGGVLRVTFKEVGFREPELFKLNLTSDMYACLTVRDTGIGMTEDVRTKSFDPFFTTKEKGKGTGMGLSVVHGIVNKMGGAIQIESKKGKGTEFKLYFPVEKRTTQQNIIHSSEVLQTGSERILLVDDEEAIIVMEKQLLNRLGYRVTSRTSPIEALDAFRTVPEQFDLVITDFSMPNMPGDRLASKLLEIRPDLKIILCTGFSEKMTPEAAMKLGIKGVLLKPLLINDLAREIRDVLNC